MAVCMTAQEEETMIYKAYQDIELSALGFGAMRLPVIDGKDGCIDQQAVDRMVDMAIENGVNYFDTAWGYHEGHSEESMGRALGRYPREKFYLADKFPGYDLSNMPKVREIFEAQLERCGVDHFDFYLFHNVCEMNIDAYLDDETYGIYSYLMEQKKNGRIRHLGFSCHGAMPVLKRFLEAYGKDMEFCQIQLNYVDWSLQDAEAKVELLNQWNIPIWVMEPVRGGKLAKLGDADEAKLLALRPDEKVVAWAFRFLQSVPGVVVTLSGMSNEQQMRENIATFSEEKPLSDAEMKTVLTIAEDMMRGVLPCTACRYCTTHCPKGLDIPALLALYNEHAFTGGGFIAPMALMAVPDDKKPSACIGCRSCEQVCPQQIKISEAMKDFTAKLG